jgi:hypothetical protein
VSSILITRSRLSTIGGYLLRGLWKVCLGLLIAWCFGAIYFDGPFTNQNGNLVLAALWLGLIVVLPRLKKFAIWKKWIVFGALILVILPWCFIRPSNTKDWSPEYARNALIKIEGDTVTVENLRNFDYEAGEKMIERWETRKVRLSQLKGLDVTLNYWGSTLLAHPIFSFDFGPDGVVAFSIETRREKGETYSTLGGLYKQYELLYLACDERDVIRVRTNYRKNEDAFLYHMQLSQTQITERFMEYVKTINDLHERPRFYNVITQNCTTSIRSQIDPSARFPLDWRLLANGYMDEMFYERGLFDRTIPFEELKKMGDVKTRAIAADKAEDFSVRIRTHLQKP